MKRAICFAVFLCALAWCGRDGIRAEQLPDSDTAKIQALQIRLQRAQLDQHEARDWYEQVIARAQQEFQQRVTAARRAEQDAQSELDKAIADVEKQRACKLNRNTLDCKPEASQ